MPQDLYLTHIFHVGTHINILSLVKFLIIWRICIEIVVGYCFDKLYNNLAISVAYVVINKPAVIADQGFNVDFTRLIAIPQIPFFDKILFASSCSRYSFFALVNSSQYSFRCCFSSNISYFVILLLALID